MLEAVTMHHHRFVLQSETKSRIGEEKISARVSGRCVGWVQGLSSGHEGRANVWISHRNAVVKAAGETTSTRGGGKTTPRGMLSTIPL